MKRAIFLVVFIVPFAGWGQQSKGSTGNVAANPKSVTPTADKDAVFNGDKDFDPASYTGGFNAISTLGDQTGTLSLYVKDGASFKPFGQLEIKGKILIGAEGLLGYKDTFRRIKLTSGDGAWKDIGRKAIKNGRLFVETKGDLQVFTVYGINAGQYTAVVEPGIHLKP